MNEHVSEQVDDEWKDMFMWVFGWMYMWTHGCRYSWMEECVN